MYHFEYTYARLLRTYVHKTYVFEVSHQILSNMCARLPRTYMHVFQVTYMYFQFLVKLIKTYVHTLKEHIVMPTKNNSQD